jgi:hypothetical protein
MKSQLTKRSIPHNSSFSGIYDFGYAKDYAKMFPRFLDHVDEGGLILCHPGLPVPAEPDPIYGVRQFEYHYLMSDNFVRDCAARQTRIR